MLQSLCRNLLSKKSKDVVVAASSTAYHGNLNPTPPPLAGTWSHTLVRHSFVGRVTENDLWEGLSSVSTQGQKGGRQRKLRARIINLTKTMEIGEGPAGTNFQGLKDRVPTGRVVFRPRDLTQKVLKPRREVLVSEKVDKGDRGDKGEQGEQIEQKEMSHAEMFIEKKAKAQTRKKVSVNRDKGIPPMQRGYHGTDVRGRSLGVIQVKSTYELGNFDTRLIDFKRTSNITSLGKKRSFRALVAIGNGNGVAGYAVANAQRPRAAIYKGVRKAAQKLQFFERYNGHTVFHDFYIQENKTKLTIQRKHKGHGVVGSLVVKNLCRLIGIHDIYVKTEGSMRNYINVTRGLFEGLEMQETHQQLANRTKLHVIETRRDRGNYPVVVASPEGDEAREVVGSSESKWLNNDSMYQGGKIKLANKRRVPVWVHLNYPSWRRKLREYEFKRGQKAAKLERLVGGLEPDEEEMKRRRVPKKRYNKK